jgi:hypothetical protein
MPYFAVDDGFADHPKTVRLQSMKGWQSALALWTLTGSWCAKHLTDGAVPSAIVTRFGGTERDADLLVAAGLWKHASDGYAFHEWGQRNPTRKAVEDKREKTRKRVTDWRSKTVGNGVTDANAGSVTNAAPIPSHPIPSQLPPNPQTLGANGAGEKPHPSRLRSHLEECVRAEFGKLDQPSEKASASQWLAGCERAQEAVDLARFPTVLEACEALARAAVAETQRPGGRALGFALQQVAFTKPTEAPSVFRDHIQPWDSV